MNLKPIYHQRLLLFGLGEAKHELLVALGAEFDSALLRRIRRPDLHEETPAIAVFPRASMSAHRGHKKGCEELQGPASYRQRARRGP